MTPSPEAIKANEDLLERMTNDFSRVFDPKLRVLSGNSKPNPTDHHDRRMHLTLSDMAQYYDPPQAPLKEVHLVTAREHLTQAETEKEIKSS